MPSTSNTLSTTLKEVKLISQSQETDKTVKSGGALTSKLQLLYKSQNTIPKLIEIDDERLQQNWKDHYIKLQLLSREKQKGNQENPQQVEEKKEIELENIFKIDDHSEAGKILLLGGAGSGKTTLLHNISYRWGEGELWNDQFDYVFRVRLKMLLDKNWDKNYTREEKEKDWLCCLIHRCLKLQISELQDVEKLEREMNLDLSEVREIMDKDKVLLLLDGYNEMESLARDKDRCDEYNDIMKKVFGYKHVIMSSRPNALKPNDQTKFERTVENKGLDFEYITKYVDSCFGDGEELGTNLKSFLERNAQVRGMCEIPINTVLICLIFEDQGIREKFEGTTEFNIGSLYREVIVWLGKRYLEKFKDKDPENIVETNVLDHPIMKFLQKVAYEAFTRQGNFVTNKVITSNLGTLDIKKVYKFGLLRAEGDKTKIIDLDYQFIHPTFQEYLTADYLRELIAGNVESARESCLLIGQHRNEPKYLMVLKFLAGIASNEQKKAEQELKILETLVTRFWDAVTCNVDETLELGLETKIALLMHLLEQGKVKGQLNTKIPNLDAIKKFIDDVLSKDITKWGEQIIESGYISEQIRQKLEYAANNIEQDNLKLRVAIEVITSLVNKSEFGGRTKIFGQVMSLVTIHDWQLQKLGLEKLHQILDKTISRDISKKDLSIIMPLIGNKNLSKYATDVLTKIIRLVPNLREELLNYLSEVVINIDIDDDYLKSEAIGIIPRIVQAVPSEQKTIVVETALQLLTSVLKTLENSSSYKFVTINNMRIQRADGCIEYKFAAIKTIAKLVNASSLGNVSQTFKLLASVINMPKIHSNFQNSAISSMVAIVENMPPKERAEATQKTYKLLLPILDNLEVDSNLKTTVLENILKLVQNIPLDQASQVTDQIFNTMLIILKNSQLDSVSRSEATKSLMKLVKVVKPNQVWNKVQQVFQELVSVIEDQEADNGYKIAFVYCIPEVFKIMIQKCGILATDTIKQAFDLLANTVNGAKTNNSTDNSNLKSVAASSMAKLVESMADMPSLSAVSNDKAMYTIRQLVLELTKPNPDNFVFTAMDSIVTVMQVMTAPQKSEIALGVLTLLTDVLEKPLNNNGITYAAVCNIVKIVKCVTLDQTFEVIDRIFTLLTNFIIHPNARDYDKSLAVSRLADLVEIMPAAQTSELAMQTYDLLIDIIKKASDRFQPSAIIKSIAKIVKFIPLDQRVNVGKQVFSILKNVIEDVKIELNEAADIKYAAVCNIAIVVKIMPVEQIPEIAVTTCNLLINVIIDLNGQYWVSSAIRSMQEVIKIMTLNKSTDLLNHPTREIREAVKKGILAKLISSEELTQIDYTQAIHILKTMDSSGRQEKYEKQLYTAANDKLKQIIADINEEGIQWINTNWGNLPNLNETRIFLKGLYHKVLKEIDATDKISTTSSEFIIKCIEYGLTTTIKRTKDSQNAQDKEYIYQLVFEDVSYTINNANVSDLESIVQATIKQENILAKQYREYKPLFENSKTGLSTAASDIKEYSILNDSNEINSEGWRLSLMHLSNHLKQEPSDVFILLEKRDYFGYHIVHKICVEENTIKNKSYELYPNEMSTSVCKDIFGKMNYSIKELTKATYYCSVLEVPIETGEKLIQKLKGYKVVKKESDYAILHKFFSNDENLQDPLWKDIPWSKYVEHESIKVLKKAALLKLDDQQREVVRRESEFIDRAIENSEKIVTIEERLRKFQNITKEINEAIKVNTKINDSDKKTMQQKIGSIEQKVKHLVENNSDVTPIITEMTKLISEGKITKGRLADLEEDVDKLQQEIGTTTNVYMLNKMVYTNPLLNHPKLLKDSLEIFSFNQILDLTPKLNQDLITDAINRGDSLLILSGLISLNHSD